MTLSGARRTNREWRPNVVGVLLLIVAVSACAPEAGAGSASPAEPESRGHGAAIGPPTSPSLELVTVKSASYGSLVVETTPGASCRASTQLPSGGTVLAGDFLTDRSVDTNGRATWSYAVPVAGAGEGSGRYVVTCALAGLTVRATAEFTIP
jgi:hypothetical protein